jgi:L-iditol 2-dehydrogenase
MATQTTNIESQIVGQIPATMRAVVYRGVNDMRVETVAVPEIGPGELLIKVATCGICGTDLKKIHTGSHSAPRIFGHEMSGTIVKVGEGMTRFELGERVVVHHHVPCGDCYNCRKSTPDAVHALQESWSYGGL